MIDCWRVVPFSFSVFPKDMGIPQFPDPGWFFSIKGWYKERDIHAMRHSIAWIYYPSTLEDGGSPSAKLTSRKWKITIFTSRCSPVNEYLSLTGWFSSKPSWITPAIALELPFRAMAVEGLSKCYRSAAPPGPFCKSQSQFSIFWHTEIVVPDVSYQKIHILWFCWWFLMVFLWVFDGFWWFLMLGHSHPPLGR